MLKKIKISVGFTSNVKVLQTSIDRPDIALHIQPMRHPLNSFKDLEFIVEAACECPIQAADILKGQFADTLMKKLDQTADIIRNAIKGGDESTARRLVQGEDVRAIVKETLDGRK